MFGYIYKFLDKVKSKLSEKGQGMVEYALILAFVAAIAVVALKGNLKGAVSGAFNDAATAISGASEKPSNTTGGENTGGENTDG